MRTRPPDIPKFSQTICIIRDVMRRTPTARGTELTELVKLRHIALGFTYPSEQIHRALRAILEGPSPVLRGNRRWDRST